MARYNYWSEDDLNEFSKRVGAANDAEGGSGHFERIWEGDRLHPSVLVCAMMKYASLMTHPHDFSLTVPEKECAGAGLVVQVRFPGLHLLKELPSVDDITYLQRCHVNFVDYGKDRFFYTHVSFQKAPQQETA